jgi:hypothetical protein
MEYALAIEFDRPVDVQAINCLFSSSLCLTAVDGRDDMWRSLHRFALHRIATAAMLWDAPDASLLFLPRVSSIAMHYNFTWGDVGSMCETTKDPRAVGEECFQMWESPYMQTLLGARDGAIGRMRKALSSSEHVDALAR